MFCLCHQKLQMTGMFQITFSVLSYTRYRGKNNIEKGNLLFHSVELECAIHACRGQIGGVSSEPNSGGHGGVIVEHLQVGPLLAQVHPDVGPGNCQVGAALVEAEVLDFVSLVELDGLEVLQLTQIPESDAGVVGGRGQVVTVF